MRAGDVAGDGETQPDAASLQIAPLIQPVKRPERFFATCFGNPRPVVVHHDLDLAGLKRMQVDGILDRHFVHTASIMFGPMKYFVRTYGCQMNVADSNEMGRHLQARGIVQTEDSDDATVLLGTTHIVGIDPSPTGPVVHWRCRCGTTGQLRTGRAPIRRPIADV